MDQSVGVALALGRHQHHLERADPWLKERDSWLLRVYEIGSEIE